jgi:hypothetical protein
MSVTVLTAVKHCMSVPFLFFAEAIGNTLGIISTVTGCCIFAKPRLESESVMLLQHVAGQVPVPDSSRTCPLKDIKNLCGLDIPSSVQAAAIVCDEVTISIENENGRSTCRTV